MYMKVFFTILLLQLCLNIGLAKHLDDNTYPFQNVSLSWDERVDDLVSRLFIDEIIIQLTYGGYRDAEPAPAIPRLGIGPYNWNTECLRGEAGENVTAFPQSIGLAATWNKELIGEISNAIAYEVRAIHILKQRGLSCFSPVINIMRHPLWGRNQETYGEDPYLSGATVTYYVHGLQGNDTRYIIANAGCKHFDVHNGPENIPVSRLVFDANVTETDWRSTFLPQFKACADAGTYSFMCSYNSINGVPACGNKKLLTDIARNAFKFNGYIISDSGALMFMYTQHNYVNSVLDAAVAAITAGVNIELARGLINHVFTNLTEAYKLGLVSEDLLRQRVRPLFYTRLRLGEFDPPEMNPYANVSLSVIQSQEHRDLAVYSAMQSFVLLKNENNYLPLNQAKIVSKKVAFIGPMSDNLEQQYGDYSASVMPNYGSTPYQSLAELFSESIIVPGCDSNKCTLYNQTAVEKAVQYADLIILSLGTGQQCEAEGNDRVDLNFPNKQQQLFEDVLNNAGPDKEIIILLFNSGPLNINDAVTASNVRAILECYLPAQAGGEAIRRVLLNDGYGANPAGRLPFTWPVSLNDVPSMVDYSMANRTYRYSTATPLFYFGYGLSYSTYKYTALNVASNNINAGDTLSLSITVQNLGPYPGDEVVQVYITQSSLDVNFTVPHANIQLVAYERVYLNVNQVLTLNFKITPEQMSIYYDPDEQFVVFPGTINVYAGGNQPRQSSDNVLSADITVNGYYLAGSYVSFANNLN